MACAHACVVQVNGARVHWEILICPTQHGKISWWGYPIPYLSEVLGRCFAPEELSKTRSGSHALIWCTRLNKRHINVLLLSVADSKNVRHRHRASLLFTISESSRYKSPFILVTLVLRGITLFSGTQLAWGKSTWTLTIVSYLLVWGNPWFQFLLGLIEERIHPSMSGVACDYSNSS
jgi:hypothetical protein